ncbi:MAG: ABC transporter permease, partial [Acidimicrobiia bacterium]|nr:ABC transporter permease [Acidimicrobiia bacterium]
FLVMGLVMGLLYSLMDTSVLQYVDQMPDALLAFVGAAGGDLTTAEGFYQVETFGLMAPIAVMVVAVTIGAAALAGEESRRTMSLLLANPVKRSRVVLEKSVAMAIHSVVVGFAIFSGVWIGSVLGGLGMDVGNIAATSALVTLLGLVFGALSLALSAATGRGKIAVSGAVGAALVFHVFTSMVALNDNLAPYAKWSPFHYFLSSDPLNNGMQWGHAALLAVLAVILVGLAVVLFDRRDLRQSA